MSVVNDVLKNLDRRHAQEKMQAVAIFPYELERPRSYWLLGLLLTSLLMVINIWLEARQTPVAMHLPADLFLIDAASEQPRASAHSDARPSPNTVQEKTAQQEIIAKDKQVVTRTAQTQAVDVVVKAMQAGDEKTVKSVLAQTPRGLREEINLRLMLKDNPQQVLPYIRQHHKDFKQQASLLALAAQAEQKSARHVNAIELYKRLIVLQPADARWRAGIAISLENKGNIRAAQRMYALAINLANLPQALEEFSQQRLDSLR
ncbi:MAG: hypothetical protein RPT11_11050 [Bermanella sp.]